MNILAISLALGTAQARERMDEKPWTLGSHIGSVETTSLSGSAQVPGYLGKDSQGDDAIHVEVKSGEEDRSWFFALSTRSSIISVSDEFVKANGLKISIKNQSIVPIFSDYDVGGQLKTVTIPSLQIGEMILNNVQALVKSSKGSVGKTTSALSIGLGALGDVAYAISPQQGTITFAPAAEGAKLVAQNGTPIAYESVGWARIQYGKKKKISPFRTLIVDVKLNGQQSSAAIEATGTNYNTVAWDVLNLDNKRFFKGYHLIHASIELGKYSTRSWMTLQGEFHMGGFNYDSLLGMDAVGQMELHVSPIEQTLSVKESTAVNWKSLAEAKLPALEKSTKPDEEGNEAEASDWNALYAGAWAAEKYDVALSAISKAIELAPEDCSNWMSLGKVQAVQNDTAASLKAYKEASVRYHQWWDNDLDTRLDIQKTQKAMPKATVEALKTEQKAKSFKEDAVWYHKQSHTCHLADGKIALHELAAENFSAVSKIYQGLDLDPMVAIAQGNAAIIQKDLNLAEAAYRQAIILEKVPLANSRYGMALYFADQGEWRFADPLFEEAFHLNPDDAVAGSFWLDNARANGVDTLKKIQDLQKAYPENHSVAFLLMREAKIAENTELLTGMSNWKSNIATSLLTADQVASQARMLVLVEKTEEAQAFLDQHKNHANTAAYRIAQADIASATGDSIGALDHLKNAARNNPEHPVLAFFLR